MRETETDFFYLMREVQETNYSLQLLNTKFVNLIYTFTPDESPKTGTKRRDSIIQDLIAL